MQTHQFFFFEKEKRFGGMRGFDIARTLAGENTDGIYLNSTVWDLLEGKRVAVKDLHSFPTRRSSDLRLPDLLPADAGRSACQGYSGSDAPGRGIPGSGQPG